MDDATRERIAAHVATLGIDRWPGLSAADADLLRRALAPRPDAERVTPPPQAA